MSLLQRKSQPLKPLKSEPEKQSLTVTWLPAKDIDDDPIPGEWIGTAKGHPEVILEATQFRWQLRVVHGINGTIYAQGAMHEHVVERASKRRGHVVDAVELAQELCVQALELYAKQKARNESPC